MLQIIYGLISAASWGAADFNGGMASKRNNPYGVVIIAHSLSLLLLLVLIAITGEPIPPSQDLLWGGAAGIGAGFGLMILYRALAEGRMSVAAPVSALVASGLTVIVGAVLEGFPNHWKIAGLALALIAVWLTASDEKTVLHVNELKQPVIAGIAFAMFFVCLERASGVSLFWSIVAVRVVSVISLFGYVTITRQQWIPQRSSLVLIVLSSVLDTVGNACYALAARFGRLDIAAVISSLYPGSTVFLASIFLKERITRAQAFGIALALVAIVLFNVNSG